MHVCSDAVMRHTCLSMSQFGAGTPRPYAASTRPCPDPFRPFLQQAITLSTASSARPCPDLFRRKNGSQLPSPLTPSPAPAGDNIVNRQLLVQQSELPRPVLLLPRRTPVQNSRVRPAQVLASSRGVVGTWRRGCCLVDPGRPMAEAKDVLGSARLSASASRAPPTSSISTPLSAATRVPLAWPARRCLGEGWCSPSELP